jgi:hypothetical protein
LVKERGVTDSEAGKSLRRMGFYAIKTRDALRCPNCGKLLFPQGEEGAFDFHDVYIPPAGCAPRRIDVEVKAGETSIGFGELRANQREWADENNDREKWLWLGIGRHIGDPKYPRKTWFIPLGLFYELEHSLGRESIPFECKQLDDYELEWTGKGIWNIPSSHPFYQEILWQKK